MALEPFEGNEVIGIKIIITKTGDGLSKAMSVSPRLLQIEDEGYIVVKFHTQKIRFDDVTDKEGETQGVYRVQIMEALGATFVDDDLVREVFEEMQDRIRKDEALRREGQQQLALEEAEESDAASIAEEERLRKIEREEDELFSHARANGGALVDDPLDE